MFSKRRRRDPVRETRGCAVLIAFYGVVMILTTLILPPIFPGGAGETPPSFFMLTRAGGLLFATCLLASAVAIWYKRRWGVILLAAAFLLFSCPLGLVQVGTLGEGDLRSFETVFIALGPLVVPYTILALALVYLWVGMGRGR